MGSVISTIQSTVKCWSSNYEPGLCTPLHSNFLAWFFQEMPVCDLGQHPAIYDG